MEWDKRITYLIEQYVKSYVEEIIEEEVKEAKKRVTEKIKNAADALALRALKYYDVSCAADRVVITVNKELEEE